MKVEAICPHCDQGSELPFSLDVAPKNDCVYELQCPEGHIFSANVLYHEFQKLFEVAVSALIDGYYRESIGSLTASYERFMELFIRVMMNAHNIDREVIKKSWKLISRQSERQLGAFIVLYGLQFQEQPKLLSNRQVELRNKVIHQGYFPDRAECISYGIAVLEFMRSSLEAIFRVQSLWDELVRSINDQGDFSEGGPNVHYYAYPLVGTNRPPSQDNKSFEEILQYVERMRASQENK